MFSFYGSKSKIVKKYPSPKHYRVMEVFAGSARYSLLYFDRDITIVDMDEKVIGVWLYLQQATEKDILSLPDVPNATVLETINGFSQLLKEEKWLIGFCANGGSAMPKKTSGRHNFNSWNRDKQRIADSLYKIKHWHIIHGSYDWTTNDTATYFVDPPYQKQGKYYRFGSSQIDYNKLGEWCLSRNGQVIVCENDGATWLPFKPLAEIPFTHFKTDEDKKKRTKEVMFYKE